MILSQLLVATAMTTTTTTTETAMKNQCQRIFNYVARKAAAKWNLARFLAG